MPKPTGQGTNNQGNNSTTYDNGGYRYTNKESGKTTSKNNNKNQPDGYSFYENKYKCTREIMIQIQQEAEM